MAKRRTAPGCAGAKGDVDSEVKTAAEAVRAANAVVIDLTRRLDEAITEMTTLSDQRKAVALAALGDHDTDAQQRLEGLHLRVATAVSRTSSFEEALAGARERVRVAEKAHAAAIKHRQARRLLAEVDRVAEVVAPLDDLARNFYKALVTALGELQGLARSGPGVPTANQLRVYCARAVLTHGLEGRSVLSLPYLAPGERITFQELCNGWLDVVRKYGAAQLDEFGAPAGATQ